MNATDLQTLETWATDPSGPVALTLKQRLLPVECVSNEDVQILYPPTYADIGYNIDTVAEDKRVALVDSVGSQANRMEPIFKTPELADLVPQIEIALGSGDDATRLSLLDLAHRGADAVVRSSGDLAKLVDSAFTTLRTTGNAGPLCAIAPTSLVFGVWDSRGTSEKRPRLIRSIIRAWDVDVLHSAAQFNSVWKELDEGSQKDLKAEADKRKKKLSEKGFADAPAVFRNTKVSQRIGDAINPEARVLGGVLVHGAIERDVTINLVALRGLRAGDDAETRALQKYLFSLALLSATTDIELFLREGCHLRCADDADQWHAVPRRGKPEPVDLTSKSAAESIRTLASNGADHFRKAWPATREFTFDLKEAKKLLASKDEEEAQPE
ncbi:MAG: type I-U CRISPR-associated RAMP protein Csb1/Cas7u [Chthoniobacterales bacterium]